MGDVNQRGIQVPGNRGGGGVQGEETVKVKLRRLSDDSGGLVLVGAYGEATWKQGTTDKIGGNLGGGTSNLYSLLPPGAEYS